MSSSRRRPELRLSISKGRDGSQYHRGGTALNITGAGRLSISQGRDAREIPVVGEVFSLDIPFHRTNYFRTRGGSHGTGFVPWAFTGPEGNEPTAWKTCRGYQLAGGPTSENDGGRFYSVLSWRHGSNRRIRRRTASDPGEPI